MGSCTEIVFKINAPESLEMEPVECEVNVTVDFVMEVEDQAELTKAIRRTLAEQFHVPMKCVEVLE